jgi:hypothetical protein
MREGETREHHLGVEAGAQEGVRHEKATGVEEGEEGEEGNDVGTGLMRRGAPQRGTATMRVAIGLRRFSSRRGIHTHI